MKSLTIFIALSAASIAIGSPFQTLERRQEVDGMPTLYSIWVTRLIWGQTLPF